MTKSLMKKQIPTIVGLIILFIGAGAGMFLVSDEVEFLPRAAPEFTPRRLQITNVTDTSFTVSWVTDEPTVGYLRYGTTPDTQTIVTDDRDQLSGDTSDYRVHHVTVRGLTASSQYYFEVGSGGESDLYDNDGVPYEVNTGKSLAAPTESESIYGKVVTQAGSPAEKVKITISSVKTTIYLPVDNAQSNVFPTKD
jgi:chitodextrinase